MNLRPFWSLTDTDLVAIARELRKPPPANRAEALRWIDQQQQRALERLRQPPPPPPAVDVPLSYRLPTHRDVWPLDPPPLLGPAGSLVVDAHTGARILRVTDERTNPEPGYAGRSYNTPSSTEQPCWNADTSMFYIAGSGNEVLPFRFDRERFAAVRLGDTKGPHGGLWLVGEVNGEPAWSYRNPNNLYAMRNGEWIAVTFLADGMRIGRSKLPFSFDGTTSDPSFSAGPNERMAFAFGGQGQDNWRAVAVWEIDSLAVKRRAMDWGIHNARIDRSGRYVIITRSGAPTAESVYVWDTEQDTLKHLTPDGGGHKAAGYGDIINNAAAHDALDWRIRSLDSLDHPERLTEYLPVQWTADDHPSRHNAQPDVEAPSMTSVYRVRPPSAAEKWRTWDGEILLIATDGSGTVWRACQHHNLVREPANWVDGCFGNVSQCGRYCAFTSSWAGSLGLDLQGAPRYDVFVVELAARGGG